MHKLLAFVVLPIALLVVAWTLLNEGAQSSETAEGLTLDGGANAPLHSIAPGESTDAGGGELAALVPVPDAPAVATPIDADDESVAEEVRSKGATRSRRASLPSGPELGELINKRLVLAAGQRAVSSETLREIVQVQWSGSSSHDLRILRALKLKTNFVEGLNTTEHDNGKPKSQGYVKGGLQTGIWTKWHPNGQRASEGPFVYGKKHGLWTKWNDAGKRISEGEFVYGEREGAWTEYHDNGNKKEVATYVNGKRDGTVHTWHVNDKRKSETFYTYGRKHLQFREWYMNGQLAKHGTYEYGKLHGRLRVMQADGSPNVAEGGVYEHGERIRD